MENDDYDYNQWVYAFITAVIIGMFIYTYVFCKFMKTTNNDLNKIPIFYLSPDSIIECFIKFSLRTYIISFLFHVIAVPGKLIFISELNW